MKKITEVINFATFLKEKYQPFTKQNIVKLGGLWKEFEPTDQEIQKARKEMWKHLDTKDI